MAVFFRLIAGLLMLLAVAHFAIQATDLVWLHSAGEHDQPILTVIRRLLAYSRGSLVEICSASILLALTRIYRFQAYENEVR